MEGAKWTIWNFFIKRHRFTTLLILVALLLGTVSIIQIPKESNPEVDIPIITVNTSFPGASAEDVEELVTNIIEDKVLGIEGVDDVTSTSQEGFSSIVVEFDPKTEKRDREDKVQDKVNEAKIDLPEEAKDPIVKTLEITNDPIYIFSLSGPYDVVQLKRFAEELKDDIDKISGVSQVNIIGGQEREIQVVVNKAALDRYGLSISQVTGAIRQANADIPTGSIKTEGADYTIRLTGRLLTAGDINDVPIASVNSASVSVKDVAKVIDGYGEKTTISRLSVDSNPPLSSVTISVLKSKGGNILRLTKDVKKVIEDAKTQYLPNNIETEVFFEMAKFIKDDLDNLVFGGMQTIIIILILLYILVGGREAIIASLAVPFSFLITFIFLSWIGHTLNFLSLFSLILALGILIDTAIVIIERMNVYINEHGKTASEAAIITVHEFQWPLIAGTLTTVFAFVPMLIMSGILGEFMKFIPITVTIVLLSSLFVGLAIIPSLGSRRLKAGSRAPNASNGFFRWVESARYKICTKFFVYANDKYKNALSSLLANRKKQRILIATVIILFVLSLLLPISGILKLNMFPPENADLFFIQVKKPVNTLLEETSATMEQIEDILLQDSNIKSFTVSVGNAIFFGGKGENVAEVVVNLKKDKDERSPDIIDRLQRKFDEKIDAEVSTIQLGSGPPTGAPVDIGVRGDDLEELESIVAELEGILKQIPGAANVQTSIDESKGEFVIRVDRTKAQVFGISTVELAQVLRNAVKGTTATVLRNQGEELDVIVKYDLDPYAGGQDTDNASIGALESLTIATPKGDIPLSAFTSVELGASRPAIRHEDGQRSFRLTSYTQSGVAPVEVISAFQERIKSVNLPENVDIVYGGEQADLEQSYNDMFRAMILAIFLIASILILQFHSYRQPLFILTTIPLSFIGVFPGLILIGSPLTLPAIIGLVALAGIVVNNGIILVDMINRNRLANMARSEAVINACITRFRPIILTTITTIMGILPITFSSELWGSLGFTIIFGLTVSAAFTLFIVPYLYFKLAEKEVREGNYIK